MRTQMRAEDDPALDPVFFLDGVEHGMILRLFLLQSLLAAFAGEAI